VLAVIRNGASLPLVERLQHVHISICLPCNQRIVKTGGAMKS
jgi:hypothetical protein